MATATDPNKQVSHDQPDGYAQTDTGEASSSSVDPSAYDNIDSRPPGATGKGVSLSDQDHISRGVDEAERYANRGPSDPVGRSERQGLSLYQPEQPRNQTFWGRLARHPRRTAAGVGGVAVLVGGLGIGTFLSQPFQFLQFASLLRQWHSLANIEFTDSRGFLLVRYARTIDSKERRNLGYLGNKFADRYQRMFEDAGLKPHFVDSDGNSRRSIQAFDIDTRQPTGDTAVRRMRAYGLSADDFQPLGDGKVRVYLRGAGSTAKTRIVIKGAMEAIDLNGLSEAIGRRLGTLRYGATRHPLRNFVREQNESRQDFRRRVNAERANLIRLGVAPYDRRAEGSDADGDGQNDPDTDQAANDGNDLVDEMQDADTPDAKRSLVRRILTGSASTGLAVALCFVNDLDQADQNFEAQQTDMMKRDAQFEQSIGSQTQSFVNVNIEELGIHSERHYDPEAPVGARSIYSAKPVQAALGQPQTGPDILPSARPAKPGERRLIFQIVGAIPGINGVCSIGDNIINRFGILRGAVDLFERGVKATLDTVLRPFGVTVEQLLLDLITFINGGGYNIAARGAEFGNLMMYGMRLVSLDQALSLAGRYLTGSQSSQLQQYYARLDENRFRSESLMTRLFSPHETRSLLAKTFIQNPSFSAPTTSYATLLRSPLAILPGIGSSMSNLALPSAYAQGDPYDYGFGAAGYTVEELELIASEESLENPYANADVMEANDSLKLRQGNERWGKCFSVKIDTSNDNQYVTDDSTELDVLDDPECQENSVDFLRYRLYIADRQLAMTYACLEGDGESCQALGFGAAVILSDGDNIDSGTCDSRTKRLGEVDGYQNGSLTIINVCAVTNLPSSSRESKSGDAYYVDGADGDAIVNASVSKNVYDMVQAASAQGVTLRADSAFRTNQHQQQLYDDYQAGSGNEAAPPGYSNHQMGLAIDFANIDKCPVSSGGICQHPASPEWSWLNRYGEQFGFKQLPSEAWHWSTTGG